MAKKTKSWWVRGIYAHTVCYTSGTDPMCDVTQHQSAPTARRTSCDYACDDDAVEESSFFCLRHEYRRSHDFPNTSLMGITITIKSLFISFIPFNAVYSSSAPKYIWWRMQQYRWAHPRRVVARRITIFVLLVVLNGRCVVVRTRPTRKIIIC